MENIQSSRQSIRLQHFDYSSMAYYYVTLCVEGKLCLFGSINNGKMNLNQSGKMIFDTWKEMPSHYSGLDLDEFVVMPNHLHGIVVVYSKFLTKNGVELNLGDLIRCFKTLTSHRYGKGVKHYSWKPYQNRLWQRNYFERVIRVDKELENVRNYIDMNPQKWDLDKQNIGNVDLNGRLPA